MAWRGLNAPANTTGAEGLNVVPWQGSDEQQGAIQGTSIELGSHGRAVMAGMRRSVAAFADLGLNVIVDDMWCNAEPAQDFAHLLDVENTWVVGLYCGESELARREAQRPTRFPGTAIRENKRVHNVTVNCSYDLELHSDKLSPAVLAEQVFERLSSPPQMLAGLLARGESL